MNLRPYQKETIALANERLKEYDHLLFGAPTGWGKSIAIRYFAQYYPGRKLILAPERILVKQLYNTLKDLDVTVLMPGFKFEPDKSIVIASTPTLQARLKRGHTFGTFDLVMVDEVHSGWNKPDTMTGISEIIAHYWGTPKWVGFSATPIDARGYRMEGWDRTIYKYQTSHLIEMGYLSEYDYYAPARLNVSGVKISSTGDYQLDELSDAVSDTASIELIKRVYKKYCKDKLTAIYAVSISHAEFISKAIEGSTVIHSKLGEKEVTKRLDLFKKGVFKAIVNVSQLTTGFDMPQLEALLIARPTKTLRLAIQIWGRGLRVHPGGSKCLIVDVAGLVEEHGLPCDIRDFNRVKPKKKTTDEGSEFEAPVKICEACGFAGHYTKFKRRRKLKRNVLKETTICPECGNKEKKIIDLKQNIKMAKAIDAQKIRKFVVRYRNNYDMLLFLCRGIILNGSFGVKTENHAINFAKRIIGRGDRDAITRICAKRHKGFIDDKQAYRQLKGLI